MIVVLVKEKKPFANAKSFQMVSGMNFVAYWLGNLVFDFWFYMLSLSLVLLLVIVVNIGAWTGKYTVLPGAAQTMIDDENQVLPCIVLLLVLFDAAMCGFTYCVSFVFREVRMCQSKALGLFILLGNGLVALALCAHWFCGGDDQWQSTLDLHDLLLVLFSFSPLFCLVESLSTIGNRRYFDQSVWHVDVTGLFILYLSVMALLFMVIVVVLDYVTLYPDILGLSWLFSVENPKSVRQMEHQLEEEQDGNEYEVVSNDSSVLVRSVDCQSAALLPMTGNGVQSEAMRVKAGGADGDIVKVLNVCKKYKGQNGWCDREIVKAQQALSCVTFGVRPGENFGLLGPSGSGKSTLLKVLNGSVAPNFGVAEVDRRNVRKNLFRMHQVMGFCPQYNELVPLLTVREHLELFVRIKGLAMDQKSLNEIVFGQLLALDLFVERDRIVGDLHEWSKRRLCLALATLGRPSVLLLDEPTCNLMSNDSKKSFWKMIKGIAHASHTEAILVASQSVQECEALCNRVSILASGKMKFVGSLEQLQHHARSRSKVMVQVKLQPLSKTEQRRLATQRLGDVGVAQDARGLESTKLNEKQVRQICEKLGHEEWWCHNSLNAYCRSPTTRSSSHSASTNGSKSTGGSLMHSMDAFAFACWLHREDNVATLRNMFEQVFGADRVDLFEDEASAYGGDTVGLVIQSDFQDLLPLAKVFAVLEKAKSSRQVGIQQYHVAKMTLEHAVRTMTRSSSCWSSMQAAAASV